jgi:hypothetical protein
MRKAGDELWFVWPFAGGVALFAFTPMFGNAMNFLLDNSAEVRREMVIVGQRTYGRAATHTYVVFKAANGPPERLEIQSSQVHVGSDTRERDTFIVTRKAGALGRPYVSKVQRTR